MKIMAEATPPAAKPETPVITTLPAAGDEYCSDLSTGFALEPLPLSALPVAEIRRAQQAWASLPVRRRLATLRKLRGRIAAGAQALAATVPLEAAGSLHRTLADTLAAEVLPLIESCRFLEREARPILAARYAEEGSRPFWLRGVSLKVEREPLGTVLIVAPANYPLFLPGAQALQALAAGNAVLWKPAPGGSAAARALSDLLNASGLDPLLLRVLDDSPGAATAAIRSGVDKVILTGSAATGRAVLHELAETLTPSVMELSGCDAVFVLDNADLTRTAAAIAFGLRLNGSATCMAPRRLFASPETAQRLQSKLLPLLAAIAPVPLPASTAQSLRDLLVKAQQAGATLLCGAVDGDAVRPILIAGAKPGMAVAQTDIAAPVLSIIETAGQQASLDAYSACPYALTAAIFGEEQDAIRLASRIRAGVVLVNDIIVSTADPRAPFGGRGASGFGVTRGREGLLEMTAPKTVLIQRSRDLTPYLPTGPAHAEFFSAYIQAVHSRGLPARFSGALRLAKAVTTFQRNSSGAAGLPAKPQHPERKQH